MTEPRQYHRSRGRRSISRTIPLPGDSESYGYWYKCWYCGMACNDKTDELDDGATRMQTTYQDFAIQSYGALEGNANPVLGGILHTFVAVQSGADGSNLGVVHYHDIVDTKGCPNCGTTNWRGDF